MANYKIFLNGEYVPEAEAKISVFDHGFLYGDGVFEGIRAYGGRVFRLDEHMVRLYDSARAIDLAMPYTREQFTEIVLETCRQNDLRDAYIRPIVSRGVGDLGLDPRKCKKPTTVVIARQFPRLYGSELYETGLSVITVSTRRTPPQAVSPNIKSLNYLNNILGRIETNRAGADEGLMLDVYGFVSEATADNFFVVKDGVVLTPPTHNSLKGITRQAAVDAARQEGYDVEERQMTLFDVYSADEAFITGTAAEIAPVVKVDGRAVGTGKPGRVTIALVDGFRRLVASTGTPIYPDEGATTAAKGRASVSR